MSFDISIFSSSKTSDDVAFKEVKEFIEKNPTKLNETIKKGSIGGSMKGNLLHFSCYWNNLPKVVSYLLSKNADVTKCFIEFNPSGNGFNSMNGLTAKQIAKKKGFGNIVSLFEQYEREPALTEKTNKISNPILGQVKEKPDPVLQPIPQPNPVPVLKKKPSLNLQPEPVPLLKKKPSLNPLPEPIPVLKKKPSLNPLPEPVPVLKKKPSLKTQPELFPVLKKKPPPIPQPEPVPVVKPSSNPQPVKEKKSDPALQPIPQPKPVPVVKPSPNPQPESVVAAHLKALGLDQFLESFDNIGVKTIEDILLLEEGDWKHMNIPPFQKNKILASIPKKGIAKDTTTNMHKNKENVGVYCIPVALLVISVPVVTVVYDHITTRATELYNEPQILNPIIGLLDIPMYSFDEIVQSLEEYVPGIENFSYTCTMFANNINNKKQKLTNDEISSINLYTCESNPRENSIYFILNKALRDQDRMALKPFFPYLRLLLRSMSKLPKCSPGTVIWRGVQTNVSSDYIKGKKIIWWGLSSCTKDMDALDTFLGKNTERTLFSVQINSAIEISQFSAHPKEEEVLVFPCVTFEVQNVYSPSQGLWIVQLKEIFSPGKLIKGFDFLGM